MNEKVAAYVQKALARGQDRETILANLRNIGVSEEEIGESFAGASKPKKQEISDYLRVAGQHSGDMFANSGKRNFEPFETSTTLYYTLDYVFAAGFLALIAAACVILLKVSWLVFLIPVAALAVGAAYSRMYVERFVFRLEDRFFFVRKGVFAHAYTLLPYENVQDIHVVQSMTGRLLGLTTVVIFTATTSGAGSELIPGLAKDGAERLKSEMFRKMKEVKHVTD